MAVRKLPEVHVSKPKVAVQPRFNFSFSDHSSLGHKSKLIDSFSLIRKVSLRYANAGKSKMESAQFAITESLGKLGVEAKEELIDLHLAMINELPKGNNEVVRFLLSYLSSEADAKEILELRDKVLKTHKSTNVKKETKAKVSVIAERVFFVKELLFNLGRTKDFNRQTGAKGTEELRDYFVESILEPLHAQLIVLTSMLKVK